MFEKIGTYIHTYGITEQFNIKQMHTIHRGIWKRTAQTNKKKMKTGNNKIKSITFQKLYKKKKIKFDFICSLVLKK